MLLRRQRNVAVHMLTIESVDIAGRRAMTEEGYTLAYDWLVMAPGAVTDCFGHPEWAVLAPGLKTVEDALAVRRRVLLAFKRAESEPDRERRRAHLTFVIVGWALAEVPHAPNAASALLHYGQFAACGYQHQRITARGTFA